MITDLEVALEFLNAHRRTGLTTQLLKARDRLPVLLSMTPERVEARFQQEMSLLHIIPTEDGYTL